MVRLVNIVAKAIAFDVYGGIIAGMGMNILTGLLTSTSRNPKLVLVAVCFILSGAFISVARVIMGGFREDAQPFLVSEIKSKYLERLQSRCDKNKLLTYGAIIIFFIGNLVTLGCVSIILPIIIDKIS